MRKFLNRITNLGTSFYWTILLISLTLLLLGLNEVFFVQYFAPPCREGWIALMSDIVSGGFVLSIVTIPLSIIGILFRTKAKVTVIINYLLVSIIFLFSLAIALNFNYIIIKGESSGPGCHGNIPEIPIY